MSKNQHKEKLLLLLHIFQRESDENHPLSVPKLLDKLQANGILAGTKERVCRRGDFAQAGV